MRTVPASGPVIVGSGCNGRTAVRSRTVVSWTGRVESMVADSGLP
jgi:hypothetical protein